MHDKRTLSFVEIAPHHTETVRGPAIFADANARKVPLPECSRVCPTGWPADVSHFEGLSATRRNASAERVTLSSDRCGRAFRDRSNHLQLESINDEVGSFYRLLKVQCLLDCLQLYGCLLLADAG